jgi:type II secretory pathway pseudopilin PulG
MKRNQAGTSLIEVVMSLQILALATLGVAQAFSFQMNLNTQTEFKSGAVFAAQQTLDEYRTRTIATLPLSGTSPLQTIAVGSRNYTVDVTYCTIPTRCTGNMRQLIAKVYYKGVKKYETETVFSELQ